MKLKLLWRLIVGLFKLAPKQPDPLVTSLLSHLTAQSTAQQHSMNEFALAMTKLAEAQMAQSKSFTDYLALFSTSPTPTPSRTLRDEDEWEMEMERSGYPIHGSAQEQAQWVLTNSE